MNDIIIIIISWYLSCLFVNCHLSLNDKWRKFTSLIMSKVFEITPRFSDLLARLTGLSNYMLRTYTYDLLQWVDTKQNQQRKKAPGVRSGGPTAKRPLPAESQRTHLIPPRHMWSAVYQGSSLERLSVCGFCWGWSLKSPLPSMFPNPDSRREAGIQHKPYG